MKKICLFPIAAAMMMSVSCVDDYLTPAPGGREVDMQFSITVPDANPAPASSTRASHSDIDIENISVFVFNGGPNEATNFFVERREATDIAFVNPTDPADTGKGKAKYTFKVRLSISTVLRNIYFVANAKDSDDNDRIVFWQGQSPEPHVDGKVDLTGKSEAQVWHSGMLKTMPLSSSSASPPTEAAMLPLVMWGTRWQSTINSNTPDITNLKLLRTSAAIDVRVASGVNNFTVLGVSAGNIAASTAVAPYNVYDWASSPANQQTPTSNLIPIAPTLANQFGTTAEPGYWSDGGDLHYVTETSADCNPYVLVHATWNSTPYYYKLQLKKNDGSGDPLDLRRNHKYIVNIMTVNGPGHTTLEAAAAGGYSNEDLVFHVDEFDELVSFVSDGHNYMGISIDNVSDEFIMLHNSETSSTFNTIGTIKVFSSNEVYSASFTQKSGDVTFTTPTFPVDPDNAMLKNLGGTVTGTGTGTITISNKAGLSMTIDLVAIIDTEGYEATFNGQDWWHGPLVGEGNGVIITPNGSPWNVTLLGSNEDPTASMNVFLMREVEQSTKQPSQVPTANNPIYWDEVASLTSQGRQEEYTTSFSGTTTTRVYIVIPTNNFDYYGTVVYTYQSGGQTMTKYYVLKR